MYLSSQALVLAVLALEGAFAQPAHRHHEHKHRRDLADVLKGKRDQYGTPEGGWHSVDKAFTTEQWSCIAACGSPTCGACASGGSDKSPAAAASAPASSSAAPKSDPVKEKIATTGGTGGGSGDVSDLMDVWTTKDPSDATGETAVDVDEKCRWGNTGNTKVKRATFAQDTALDSNAAAPADCPTWYPYNIHPLKNCDSSTLSSYDNSAKITNKGAGGLFATYDKSYRGPDGCMMGGTDCGGQKLAFFTFFLNAGQSACFGIDNNAFLIFVPNANAGRAAGAMWDINIIEATTRSGTGASSSYDVSNLPLSNNNASPVSVVHTGSPAPVEAPFHWGMSTAETCNWAKGDEGQTSISQKYPSCLVDVPGRLDLQICMGTNSAC